MGLEQHIQEIRAALKTGGFKSEAAVSQGVVLRLLSALGWPAYDTQTVIPQYIVERTRVDYALCHPPSKPIAFIEVKNIGKNEGAERQLFQYAFHKGVQFVILTDGQEWDFFLPAEQGDYAERRVYKLNIVERELEECVSRLSRYLKYESIVSGDAIEAARNDYRDVSRNREMKNAMPKAWTQLIQEDDEILLELLADKVENLCGYKPNPDSVAFFLKKYVVNLPSGSPPYIKPPQPPNTVPEPEVPTPKMPRPKPIGFELFGKHYQARNASDVLVQVFQRLIDLDPSFQERFADLPRHGRTRRYLAHNRDNLYPGRPDLARDHSKQLNSGWWVGTNHSRATIKRIIEMACNVAQIRYDDDLRVELGE